MSAQQASAYLNSTDWYVIRMLESGVPVPAQVTELRKEARLIISQTKEQNV